MRHLVGEGRRRHCLAEIAHAETCVDVDVHAPAEGVGAAHAGIRADEHIVQVHRVGKPLDHGNNLLLLPSELLRVHAVILHALDGAAAEADGALLALNGLPSFDLGLALLKLPDLLLRFLRLIPELVGPLQHLLVGFAVLRVGVCLLQRFQRVVQRVELVHHTLPGLARYVYRRVHSLQRLRRDRGRAGDGCRTLPHLAVRLAQRLVRCLLPRALFIADLLRKPGLLVGQHAHHVGGLAFPRVLYGLLHIRAVGGIEHRLVHSRCHTPHVLPAVVELDGLRRPLAEEGKRRLHALAALFGAHVRRAGRRGLGVARAVAPRRARLLRG